MSLRIGQIFALIAEAPEAMVAAQELATWYNKHSPTIGRIMNILDPKRDNPLPPEEAKKRAIEIIQAEPELRAVFRNEDAGG